MNILNICFFIINIILLIYQLILLYSQIKKTSANLVMRSIMTGIVNWVAENTGKSSRSPSFRLESDPTIPSRLCNAVDPYNALPLANVGWFPSSFSTCQVPCLSIDLVPKNGTADFPVIRAVLEAMINTIMAECAIPIYRCRIIFRQVNGASGLIHILYATTDSEIKAFQKQLNSEISHARKVAVSSVAPTVDQELEEDIDLFGEDKEI